MSDRTRTSFASSDAVRQRMRNVARKDTAPELAVRRSLHKLGMRYFVHRRPLPGLRRQADVVFPKAKVAVFVDGCFWHGCPEHAGELEKTNGWYWPAKIQSNRDRDADTNLRLDESGWVAVRIWEHGLLTRLRCESPNSFASVGSLHSGLFRASSPSVAVERTDRPRKLPRPARRAVGTEVATVPVLGPPGILQPVAHHRRKRAERQVLCALEDEHGRAVEAVARNCEP